MVDLGKRISELRQQKGITQKELATFLDITPRSLQRYEANDREPNIEQLTKLADFFNVSLDFLVGRSDDPKRH